MTDSRQLQITTSPHLRHRDSVQKIMWNVFAALVPAALWGVLMFGLQAAIILAVALASALLAEYAMNLLTRRRTMLDGSAWITGLLVGMNMPPDLPLYIPVVASLFAILVVKWTFGGLGRNWMNPALAGRAFVFFSWSGVMGGGWKAASGNPLDGLSGATVLGSVKTVLMETGESFPGPLQALKDIGYMPSRIDQTVSSGLRGAGLMLPDGYVDLFLGNLAGCIGEVSALLLLIGGLYLLIRRYANWQIVGSGLLSFSLLVLVFGGLPFNGRLFSGDLLFHLFSGGLMLGLFFMATDMVSSPVNGRGMLVYGSLIGALTFLIRVFGSFPEGISLAILLMNIAVPLIDHLTKPRIFGTGKRVTGVSQ